MHHTKSCNNHPCINLIQSFWKESWNIGRNLRVITNMFSKPISLLRAIVVLGSLFSVVQAEAWEVNTHRELTEKAIEIIETELNGYLENNLGLEGGLNASLPGGSPRKLMSQGSDLEDETPRYLSHFHDPISNSGLGHVFPSAVDWSLFPKGAQFIGGSWSWNDAREYYFKALTSPTKTERDKNWAKTFRALGQIMHLLQDSANPAHVRDDPHVLRDGLHDFMDRHSVASYSSAGTIGPDSSMLEVAGAMRNEPFSNLFDRNMYYGSNPGVTLGADVGITEYASANFFSDDRIAGQNSPVPPYPSLAELVPAPAPSSYLTLARLGSAAFPGARVAKYTGNETLSKFLNLEFDLLGKLRLDDGVYDAYARHLIPRAVGYSAAVLNYFFRGKIPLHKDKDAYEYLIARHYVGGPLDEEGFLDINFDIPQDVAFEGSTYLYLDLPGGQRILGSESFWDEYYRPFMFTFPDGAINFSLFTSIPRDQLDQSFRWTIVWEGKGGPGAQEPRIIIGQTGMATWKEICVC